MKRWVVLHPQAVADAVVLVASGALMAASCLLLRFARAGDDGIGAADFGGERD